MDAWIFSLAAVTIVSLLSLIGVFTITIGEKKIRKAILFLVSFAVGSLFGDALIHLLPEAFEKIQSELLVSLLVLAGIIGFFILEKFVCWRHCHITNSEEHIHPVAVTNLIGDAAHNFIDGVLIGASFLVSFPLGLATTIAVVLHEIPQEIGDFGVLLHAGFSAKKALILNFFSALVSFAGVALALLLGVWAESAVNYIMPVAAGGFLYIAGSDLIPELKHETKITASFGQLLAIILGIGVMAALLFLE